jgi:hypothetical protein
MTDTERRERIREAVEKYEQARAKRPRDWRYKNLKQYRVKSEVTESEKVKTSGKDEALHRTPRKKEAAKT